jgi:glycosyltransferase involved in cell wall biosynthesis
VLGVRCSSVGCCEAMQKTTGTVDVLHVPQARKMSITAIVLTLNEEMHIDRCLSRIMPLVERVVLVDSFSTDRTVEIAKSCGADVLQHAWKNYSDQFQWGLDTAKPLTDWVLRLDADEYLEDGAQAELRRRLAGLPADVTGLQFKLKVIFWGRWIRHGRYYSTILLRLWRNGVGQIEQRWMDEHIVLAYGRTERITGGDLVDHNCQDIGWWTNKHNHYATRHMVDYINREYHLFAEDKRIRETKAAARTKRFLKNSVYGRAPLYLRAVLFYLYRYFVRLGFLDGKEGFVFHFLHGFWMMMLIDAKIDEARTFISTHGTEAFRKHLKLHHKIEI